MGSHPPLSEPSAGGAEVGSSVVLLEGRKAWDPYAGEESTKVAVWDREGESMIGGRSAPKRCHLRDFLKDERYEVSWRYARGGGGRSPFRRVRGPPLRVGEVRCKSIVLAWLG